MIRLKKILAAWIYQELAFDSEAEVESYLMELESKKAVYAIDKREGCNLVIRKKYNNNNFPRKVGV